MTKDDKVWIKMMELGHLTGCHQIPERSFSFHGYQFPVCARCTGVVIGELASLLYYASGRRMKSCVSLELAAVMGLDWFIQDLGIKQSTNLRRLITGVCGGIGVYSLYFSGILFLCRKLERSSK